MRNPERIGRILDKVRRLWEVVPDWRLGQLLFNLSRKAGGGGDSFYLEDDQLEAQLDIWLADLNKRRKQQ